jgi:Ca2+-binding EF-hand superfamily protein
MHHRTLHQKRHAKRDAHIPTPPNKNPRWKKMRTPPRRIRPSPLSSVKGHFDHLRTFSRQRNSSTMTKHQKLVPVLPPGTPSSTRSTPYSTHSFDSVSSMEDFIYHQKPRYVETPATPKYARSPRQAKLLDRRNSEWAAQQPRVSEPSEDGDTTERYQYTPSKKKFVEHAPHLVPMPWERAYKVEDKRLTEAQEKALEKEIEESMRIVSPRERTHMPLQVIKALRRKMTDKDNGASKIIRVFKQFDIGGEGGGSKDDNFLDVEEVQNGLNNLLHLNLSQNEAQKVMKLVDRNGDGRIGIEEFLYAAKSNDIAEMIQQSELKMPRGLIKPEKRRRAMHRKKLHGVINKDHIPTAGVETAFHRRRLKAKKTAQFRNAYHEPWKVLKRLREGITMKNIIKTFKLMDVGNSAAAKPLMSKWEKKAEDLENLEAKDSTEQEIRVQVGTPASNHNLDRTVGYNDMLEPQEIKNGLNKFLNFNLDDDEVGALMKVIDKNGDGELSFGELFEAIAGPEVENYIEDHLRTAQRYLLPDDHLKKFKITGKITARKDDEHRGDAHPLEQLSQLDEQRLKPSKIAKFADRDVQPDKKTSVNWLDEHNPHAPGYMDVYHTKKKRWPNTYFIEYDPKIHSTPPPKEWYQRADEIKGWKIPVTHGDHHGMMKVAAQTDCINKSKPLVDGTKTRRLCSTQVQPHSQIDFAFSPAVKLEYKRPPRGTSPCVW